MNTKTLVGIILILILLACCILASAATVEEPLLERVTVMDDENLLNYSTVELENLIKQQRLIQNNAHQRAEQARANGLSEDSRVIKNAQTEWWNAHFYITVYMNRHSELLAQQEQARWNAKKAEYPHATTIWLYMKNLGWNDYVCAGIMGNLMAEVGGQTLNIQYWLKGNGYYGMCQWNTAYRSKVWGADLIGQCDFLRDTIKYEIDTFGKAYKKGFNLNSFLALTNEKDAALAFAKCYERCASTHYNVRLKNATVAYNYFVNN